MHIKYGLKSTLRQPGHSAMTLLLFFLVVALLGTSMGMTRSLQDTLLDLNISYTTLALAELESDDTDRSAAEITRILAEYEALNLPGSVISWQPEQLGLAYLPQSPEVVENRRSSDYGVVLITTKDPGPFSERNTLPAVAEAVLFSVKRAEGRNLEIYAPGIEPGKHYLVYGRWYIGTLGVDLNLEALTAPLEVPDLTGYESVPGAQAFLDRATELEIRRNSVMVVAPEDLDRYFPFQQKAVQLTSGRLFTQDEQHEGAKVCLISEALAKHQNLKLGDAIPISIACSKGRELYSGYEPSQGFDLEAAFEVVGILHTKESWKLAVFLPPQPGLDLSGALYNGVLGQFQVKNDQADSFLRWAETSLPQNSRVTLYDQGYSDAAEPLRLMLRTVRMITAVCTVVGLGFLILNLWLFVSRQRRAMVLMDRLGARNWSAPLYFVSGMLPLLLPALGIGIWFSRYAAQRITQRLSLVLEQTAADNGLYSEAKLSLQNAAASIRQPVGIDIFLILGGVILVCALLLCLFFTRRVSQKKPERHRVRGLRVSTRTHPLTGGGAKLALLSAHRGGFRTAMTLLAPLAAFLLFCGLQQATRNTEAQLYQLEKNTTVRGYFTDLYGVSAYTATLRYDNLFPVADLPQTVSATVTQDNSFSCHIVGKLEDYKLTGPTDYPEIPYSKFQEERLLAYSAIHDPPIWNTDSMEDVPQLMFRGAGVQWLEGWGNQDLAYQMPEDGGLADDHFFLTPSPADTWEENQALVKAYVQTALDGRMLGTPIHCVISSSLAQAYDLKLGDSFLFSSVSLGSLTLAQYHVIGIYSGNGTRDPVFIPANLPLGIGPEAQALREEYGRSVYYRYWRDIDLRATGVSMTDWAKEKRPSSAVFRFSAEDLQGLKDALSQYGITQVGDFNGSRIPFLLEDQVFLATKRSIEQRIWYMERIFPVMILLSMGLSIVLSALQLLSRRREIWLMHCTGTRKVRAFGMLFWEQTVLCITGGLLGAGICHALHWSSPMGVKEGFCFVGLWIVSACVTALRLIRHPSKTGRDE